MKPSKSQLNAMNQSEGPCIVIAGPGSGKTFTIANRIHRLITKNKVRPEEILVITFTRAASFEMKERFEKIMGHKNAPVTFGTFHGVYFGILKWAYGFTSENILGEEEKYQLLRQILNSPELDYEMESSDEKEELREWITEISNVKNRGIEIEDYMSARHGENFVKVFRMYEYHRKKMRKIDFDDMLVLCLKLFRSRNDLLEQWQRKFKYILVDEFQDVNRIQYEVIKMLALPENNLFVVGDDDQSIYQFRGASPGIMLGFEKDYPDAKKIILNQNYRCSKNILNGAQRVIKNNQTRFSKTLISTNGYGENVHVQEVLNTKEESLYVIKCIEELKKKGENLSDIAILYRTSIDARVMIEQFMEHQIPFQTREHIQNIYDHFIARNLMSYTKLADGERNRRLFLDIMNVPVRYLSRECLDREQVLFEDFRKFYMDKSWMLDRIDQMEWDIKMMKGKTPYACIQYIRSHIGYDGYLKEYAKTKKISEDELFAVLDEIQEKSKDFKTTAEWYSYIARYESSLKNIRNTNSDRKDGVRIMTIHGSKGLEFNTVFMIQCNEGIIPYKKAKVDSELEEERRMFYVAMTRAKKKLVLSYVKEKNGKETIPSRFVQELLLVE